jgi:hypothetical protein
VKEYVLAPFGRRAVACDARCARPHAGDHRPRGRPSVDAAMQPDVRIVPRGGGSADFVIAVSLLTDPCCRRMLCCKVNHRFASGPPSQ